MTRWHVQVSVPGSPWVWVGAGGRSTMDPDAAHPFATREAAQAHADTIGGPRSSVRARVMSRKVAA